MKSARSIFIFVLISTILSIYIYYNQEETINLNQDILDELIDEDIPVRKVIRGGEKSLVDHRLTNVVYHPGMVKVNKHGIYILDISDQKIKRYNFNYEMVSSIGGVRGEGPGEVGNITDFDIQDDHVWVMDGHQNRAMKYDQAGNYIEMFNTSSASMRIVETESGVVVAQTMHPDGAFQVLTTGDRVDVRGSILADYGANPISLTGHMAPLPEGGFAYILYDMGYMLFVDDEINITNAVSTPDASLVGSNVTVRKSSGGNAIFIPDRDGLKNGSISIDGEYVYITSNTSGISAFYLDRYDLSTGSYLNSYEMDGFISGQVYNNVFYGMYRPDGEVELHLIVMSLVTAS